MQKILYPFFTLALISPTLTVLACSTQTSDQEKPPAKDDKPNEKEKIPPENKRLDMEVVKKLPRFEVDGQPYNVINDGLYLVKKDYQGVFWWGDKTHGTQVDAQVVPLHTDMPFGSGLSLFADGDSFYVLYNDDDNDGHSIAHFLESFYLDDTNLITNEASLKVNRGHFNAAKIFRNQDDYSIGIPFYKTTQLQGRTPRYYCEQSKRILHKDWDKYFAEFLAKETNRDAIAVASNFWNVKTSPNEAGRFDHKNPGNPGAHQNWYPLVGDENYFSYEITHQNAVKVTFNKTPNKPYIDARFILTRDNALTSEHQISAQDAKIYSAIVGGSQWHKEYLQALPGSYDFRAVKTAFHGNERIHKIGESYIYRQRKHVTWLGKEFDKNPKFQGFRLDDLDGSSYHIKPPTPGPKPNEWVVDLYQLIPDGKHFKLTKFASGDSFFYQLDNVSEGKSVFSGIFAIKEMLVV
ncbi:hypothetical protein [Mycoplasma sp. ATU-Cv-703]|uniref:hypothetical protein n=1 Tax=Mycoplasma sp. ATU-Cv-703 TaxID=2498595 RepID=UPI000FDD679C